MTLSEAWSLKALAGAVALCACGACVHDALVGSRPSAAVVSPPGWLAVAAPIQSEVVGTVVASTEPDERFVFVRRTADAFRVCPETTNGDDGASGRARFRLSEMMHGGFVSTDQGKTWVGVDRHAFAGRMFQTAACGNGYVALDIKPRPATAPAVYWSPSAAGMGFAVQDIDVVQATAAGGRMWAVGTITTAQGLRDATFDVDRDGQRWTVVRRWTQFSGQVWEVAVWMARSEGREAFASVRCRNPAGETRNGIAVSNDSGLNWSLVGVFPDADTSEMVSDIHMATGGRAWVVRGETMFATADLGVSWRATRLPWGPLSVYEENGRVWLLSHYSIGNGPEVAVVTEGSGASRSVALASVHTFGALRGWSRLQEMLFEREQRQADGASSAKSGK